MRQIDDIAVAVSDNKMGCVLAFRSPTVDSPDMRLLSGLDPVRKGLRIGFRHQALDRHIDEIRVSHAGVLVDGRQLHRLGNRRDIGGRIVPHAGKVETFEDVQHLKDHQAATRKLIGRNLKPAIAAYQGRMCGRLALFKVLFGQKTAMRLHIGHDGICYRPAVERLDTFFGNLLIGPSHIGVAQTIAHLQQLALVIQIYFSGGWQLVDHRHPFHPPRLCRLHPERMHFRPHRKTIKAVIDGRLHHLGK